MLLTLLVFFVILSVLVLIHEAGHFFVAKKFGIKVEEFGFGLPPRAWGKKKGETIYSLNWLPIGGFVKLYGEDDAGAGRVSGSDAHTKVKDEKRAFYARPVWQRAAVVVAGVVMNTLLAFVIYYAYLGFSGFQNDILLVTDHQFTNVDQTNYNQNESDTVMSVIVPDSPAQAAGIKTPSQLLTVNGKAITNKRDQFIDIINKNKGKQVTMSWRELKTGQIKSAVVTPRSHPPKNEGPLGVGFYPIAYLSYATPSQKIFSGITYPVDTMVYSLQIMWNLIKQSFVERNAAPIGSSVSGPIGIAFIVNQLLKLPFKEAVMQLLNLTGLLSMSLAFFNVLPIPALDGGRLFFILLEGVTGKKVNPRIEGIIHTVGMAVLLTLILLITFKDIFQFFG